jgi:acetyl-CoA carboxylase carboxyltransferase component
VLDRARGRVTPYFEATMSWNDEIDELRRRESLALQMGGPDKVARQHEFGKLTIRERIAAISDAGSFHEIGTLAANSE